jgi:hypothetical protein
MDYNEIRNFIQKTNTDLLIDNKNYNTQNYIYYFMDDQIEYDALIEFQNKTIRSIIFPLLEKKYQTTLFKFYLHLIISPNYIVCKVKSHTPDLVNATLIIKNNQEQENFDVIIQDLDFIYKDKTPKLLVDSISYLVKSMIKSDIYHFLQIMKKTQC